MPLLIEERDQRAMFAASRDFDLIINVAGKYALWNGVRHEGVPKNATFAFIGGKLHVALVSSGGLVDPTHNHLLAPFRPVVQTGGTKATITGTGALCNMPVIDVIAFDGLRYVSVDILNKGNTPDWLFNQVLAKEAGLRTNGVAVPVAAAAADRHPYYLAGYNVNGVVEQCFPNYLDANYRGSAEIVVGLFKISKDNGGTVGHYYQHVASNYVYANGYHPDIWVGDLNGSVASPVTAYIG